MKGNEKKGLKQKKLAVSLTLRLAVAATIVFLGMIMVLTSITRSDLERRELENLALLAKENATVAKDYMETMLHKQDVLLAALESIETVDSISKESRGIYLSALFKAVKEQQNDILSLYFIAEPNTFVPNSPNGVSIVSTAQGTKANMNQFSDVNKDIYEQIKKEKSVVIVDPFKKQIDGKEYLVIAIVQPVLDKNQNVVGMIGSNIDTALLTSAAFNSGDYETFQNLILCGHQTIFINSRNVDTVGQKYVDASSSTTPEEILEVAKDKEPAMFLDEYTDGSKNYRAVEPFFVGDTQLTWLSGSSISKAEFDAEITKQVLIMLLSACVGLVVLLLITFIGVRHSLLPLKDVEEAVKEMEKGNLHTTINQTCNDEIGRVAASFNASVSEVSGYIADINRAMSEMSNGNFDVYPSKPFIGDFAGFEKSITDFIVNMCAMLKQMNIAADTVSEGAQLMSEGASTLSQGSTEQASSVEALSMAIINLSEHVEKNFSNAKNAVVKVGEASDQLQFSNQQMQEMVDAMANITENSSQIGKIIKTIEDIAFQTNILALNAAVEAARAGEAGKGFAVVADEVRNLAGKSAEAAKNTTAMIYQSIESVNSGAQIAEKAADSLHMVLEKAQEVSTIVSAICEASEVQFTEIENVSASSEQISQVIQNNSATAEETAATAEELSAQAQTMKALMKKFVLNKMLTK